MARAPSGVVFWSSLEDLASFWQSFGAKSPCGVIHGGPSSCLGQICEFGLDFVRYSPSGIEGFLKKCETFIKFALWGAPGRTRFHCKKHGFLQFGHF